MNRKPPPPPRSHGGKREGSGRKADWLREKCAKLIDKKKLLNWLARVASGEETEKQVAVLRDADGSSHTEIVEIPCDTKDRLHAFELLVERGYGRPTTPITLEATEQFADLLIGARQRLNGSKEI